MKAAVLDASVAVKWVIREPFSDEANSLLSEGVDLYAPSHWLAEASTTAWARYAVSGLLTREQAEERVEWLRSVRVMETPIRGLLAAATEVSFDLGMTFYDSLYLALAQQVGVPVVTADRKLLNKALAQARLAGLVRWIGDV